MVNMLIQPKDLSDGADDVVPIRLRGLFANFRYRPVGDLVHHAFGERFDGLFLLRSQRAELGSPARDFSWRAAVPVLPAA